ncbi:cupin domain-containing protein [Echinicola rosea]|uniref:DUF985 domain-containing protein n=1 Tax=Echinicola rosea TaxID=1807691 RepID=A0ABQ1UVQ4_9BACT|nr:cupin domain-containing protein [Echinicola rosea]GGF28055.1 hypothetical protein GCM10011339_15240 [Echinicola rosea]
MTAVEIIESLDLKPHPEGGYFKEAYRSQGIISQKCLGEQFEGDRNYATGIYFLLTSDTFSAFHRIRQDEAWHFYLGSPLRLHSLSEKAGHEEFVIGADLLDGQIPQLVVPADHWFAAEVMAEDGFALVGCTVSPGFDFRDFELADQNKLTATFPDHAALVAKFTR